MGEKPPQSVFSYDTLFPVSTFELPIVGASLPLIKTSGQVASMSLGILTIADNSHRFTESIRAFSNKLFAPFSLSHGRRGLKGTQWTYMREGRVSSKASFSIFFFSIVFIPIKSLVKGYRCTNPSCTNRAL